MQSCSLIGVKEEISSWRKHEKTGAFRRDDDDFVSPPMTALDTYRESATARASIIEEDGCTRRAVTPDNAARLLPSFKQESLQGGGVGIALLSKILHSLNGWTTPYCGFLSKYNELISLSSHHFKIFIDFVRKFLFIKSPCVFFFRIALISHTFINIFHRTHRFDCYPVLLSYQSVTGLKKQRWLQQEETPFFRLLFLPFFGVITIA